MPTRRGALAVAVLDGKIHAIGGAIANVEQATHEVYDPLIDLWETRAPMPTPRHHHAAATIDGRIYVGAGRQTSSGFINLKAFEVYDPATDSWTASSPVPTGRSGVAAVALGGVFYLFGGEGPGGTFDQNERFDPATGTWEQLAPMPTARHGLGAAVAGGAIYAVGGGPQPGFFFSGANERFTPP